jgi:serine/threonine protein kinase
LIKTELQWRNHQGLPLDREKMERLYPDHIPLIRQQFIRLGKMPQIPGFLWLEELGSGSFGVVYKALQTSLNRPVAINVIDFGGDPDRPVWEEITRLSGGSYQEVATSDSPDLLAAIARMLS